MAQLSLFGPQITTDDAQLEAVAEDLVSADPEGCKIGRALRRTYDMLLDGQHTGRYRWQQLSKTEKAHFGTLAEINLQRAFAFADGKAMDFAIRGIDVRVSRSAPASPASDRTMRDSRASRWTASAGLRRCRPIPGKTHRCSPALRDARSAPPGGPGI